MDFEKWVASQKKVMTNFKLKGKTKAVGEFLSIMAETKPFVAESSDSPFPNENDWIQYEHDTGYNELPLLPREVILLTIGMN